MSRTKITENENYELFVEDDYTDVNGDPVPYSIVSKKYGVVESRVDTESQALIFMFQMNNMLLNDNWKDYAGVPREDTQILSLVDTKNDQTTEH